MVSNVERIVVEVPGDTLGDPLQVDAVNSAFLGSKVSVSATYRSPYGVDSYDPGLEATVFVNGTYMGTADRYPYRKPMPWEEDPGYKFIYDFDMVGLDAKEVEFVIVDGDLTFSTIATVLAKQSPFTDDYEFLKHLYNGLYDRDPQGSEISAYLSGLRNESLSKHQIFDHLRSHEEFLNARDLLLLSKTLHGVWELLPMVLEATDQDGYTTAGTTDDNVVTQAELGIPYTPADENASALGFYEGVQDDHANLIENGTWIGMNDTNIMSVLSYNLDRDVFKIKSANLENEGALKITINRAPFGEVIQSFVQDGGGAAFDLGVQFLDGTYTTLQRIHGIPYSHRHVAEFLYDLSGLKNVDFYTFSVVTDGSSKLGGVLLTTSNDAYLDQANFLNQEEIALLNIESRVNGFDPFQSLTYQTNSFSYTNQFGQIETHDPESFFNRLFRNKYEQDPSAVQSARGVNILKDANQSMSQLQFLHDFANDNSIITTGGFNYTHDLGIPNVPIDGSAFAETALMYTGLLRKVPSNDEVAYLTLTPQYKLRPLAERARLVMEMSEYGSSIWVGDAKCGNIGRTKWAYI